MSYGESPYQSPESKPAYGYENAANAKPKKPGLLLAISIILLILGIMGLLGGLCGIAATAGSSVLMGFIETSMEQAGDDMPEEDRNRMEASMAPYEAMQNNMILVLGSAILSTVASIFMLVAGISGMKSSPSSKMLLTIALVGCIISNLVGMAATVIQGLATQSLLKDRYPDLADEMVPGQVIGMAFNVGFAGLFLVGYFVMLAYLLMSKQVKAYYESLA